MGSFLWRDRAKQLIDFESLSFGKLHPTDIDAIMEFDNHKLILFEYKYNGKDVDIGQRILLQRLADNWRGESIVIIADHFVESTETDVDAGQAIVRELYHKNVWYSYKGKQRTVRSVVLNFAREDIEKKTGMKIPS